MVSVSKASIAYTISISEKWYCNVIKNISNVFSLLIYLENHGSNRNYMKFPETTNVQNSSSFLIERQNAILRSGSNSVDEDGQNTLPRVQIVGSDALRAQNVEQQTAEVLNFNYRLN